MKLLLKNGLMLQDGRPSDWPWLHTLDFKAAFKMGTGQTLFIILRAQHMVPGP